jgi:hypothetical protein
VEPVAVAAIGWDEFLAWAERHREALVECRVRRGGAARTWQTGTLSVEATYRRGSPPRINVRVKDNRRAAGSRYYTLIPRNLENGDFQLKDGARYRPFTAEDLAR